MPVSCSMVFTVQATPSAVWLPSRLPMANASLILYWVGADSWPSPISQAGMFTQESRGIDMTSAHFLSAGMWMIIRVSDWSVTSPLPYALLSPCARVGPDDHDVLRLRVRVHRLARRAGRVMLSCSRLALKCLSIT